MEVAGGDCNSSIDMDVAKSNQSTSLVATTTSQQQQQQQHTTTDNSSIMNPENHNELKMGLCTKRKAGEMEPDMENSLKANHQHHHFGNPSASSSSSIQRRGGGPPLKKRFSLDLLSEASAMLAQGLGPSRIQEICKQKETAAAAAAAAAKMSETRKEEEEAPTVSNNNNNNIMAVMDTTKTHNMNGENTTTSNSSTLLSQVMKSVNNAAATSSETLNRSSSSNSTIDAANGVKQENHPNGNKTTAAAEPMTMEQQQQQQSPPVNTNQQEVVNKKQQEQSSIPMQTDEPSLPLPPPSETGDSSTSTTTIKESSSSQHPPPPQVGWSVMKKEAPIRTVSETEQESHNNANNKGRDDDAKKDKPSMMLSEESATAAVLATTVKESSQNSMPGAIEDDSKEEEDSQQDDVVTANDTKKDEPMQSESAAAATTVEESKNSIPAVEKDSQVGDTKKDDEAPITMLSESTIPDSNNTTTSKVDDDTKMDEPIHQSESATVAAAAATTSAAAVVKESAEKKNSIPAVEKVVVSKDSQEVEDTKKKDEAINMQSESVFTADDNNNTLTVEESSMSVEESKDSMMLDEVKKDTPMQSVEPAAETENSPGVEGSKNSIPAAVEEVSKDSQVDETKKDESPTMQSEESTTSDDNNNNNTSAVEESKTLMSVEQSEDSMMLDEVKKDTPMQEGVPDTGNSVQEAQATPLDDMNKDTPAASDADAADAVVQQEESQNNNAKADVEAQKDTPMLSVPAQPDNVVPKAATVGDDANTKDVPLQASPANDKGSPATAVGDKDTPAQAVGEEDGSAVEKSLDAEIMKTGATTTTTVDNKDMLLPEQTTAAEADTSTIVEKSLDAEMKNSTASDGVQNAVTNGEKPKEQATLTEPVKETKDESVVATAAAAETDAITETKQETEQQDSTGGEKVEEVKEEKLEPTATNDTIKGAAEGNSGPNVDDVVQEPVVEEKGEAMNIDEPVVEETKGKNEEPIITGETKPENGNSRAADDKVTENKEESEQPEANYQVPEEKRQENGKQMEIDESAEESKEPILNSESVEETKEANPEPMTIGETMKLTKEAKEVPVIPNEPSNETNEVPATSDEPVKRIEEDNAEPMAIDESNLGEEAADPGETSEGNHNVASREVPVTSDAPTTSEEKHVDSAEGVNGMTEPPRPAMDIDTTESHENSSETETKPSTAGENGTASASQAAPAEKSDAPTTSDEKHTDSAEGVNGMNGSSRPAMDIDTAKSQEKASETDAEPTTAGENGTASASQTAPTEKKKTKKKHMDPHVLEIRKRIQFACRDNDLSAAMKAYDEAIEKSIKVEAQSFYNLLNLCDGLERSIHIGTPKDKSTTSDSNDEIPIIDEATRLKFAFRLRDHMKELNLPLNEAAYSAIVKLLSKAQEFDKAVEILEESETVQQCKPKLRLYSSLLIAFCEAGRMLDALEIWKKLTMRKLHASEKEYAALMQCATSTGDCTVFERVLTNLAEDVLVPSKGTVSRILEWFEIVHSSYTTPLTKRRADETKVKEYLEQIHMCEKEMPPSMGPVVNVNGWQISSACPIDMKSGILQTGCLKGCKLNPVIISQRAWDEMKDMNEKIVTEGQVEGHNTQFQGGKKGKKRMDFSPQERRMEWDRFTKFLEYIGHVDVVIDGANVGCFAKNFAGAPKHIDYHQIDWIVQHFSKMGKKVLLVLHERHFARNLMPDNFRWLEHKWMKNKNLYKTPRGMNDDWFWLHVAYTHQSLLVSNDEMRDHHFQMLAPRTFLRWKERHHAHFDFGNWIIAEDGTRQREVLLTLPEAYSRRLQHVEDGLVVPLAKRGDSNRFMDGGHIAGDDEPEEETYLCIRPNQREQQA